jgi:tRNA/tmRNA/rRNA uracil-C5-methylase (TrmA/RlmC/RlmD family)
VVGDRLTVTVGPVAHGGHCVARHEGQVLFVRHVLPDEVVEVEVTEVGPKGRYLRAEARRVVTASPARVTPPCAYAGACGGCDFQHVALGEQRRLKATVVTEQLTRLGRVDWAGVWWSGEVEPVPLPGQPAADLDDGLHWRTRVRFAIDPDGRAGFRRHRSHDVVAVDDCLIAHPLVEVPEITGTSWPGVEQVSVTVSTATGERVVDVGARQGSEHLEVAAAGRRWQVSAGGFWQVHPGAADILVDTVLAMADPRRGEHLVDLYAGVGLFGGAWGSRVAGPVDAVEGHRAAAADALANLADLPEARVHAVPVERFVRSSPDLRPDVVVLDPPRVGAKRAVVEPVAAWGARVVVYVACDPASLGRDVALFAEQGYRLGALRAFDLFPMTHHVECVALLERV